MTIEIVTPNCVQEVQTNSESHIHVTHVTICATENGHRGVDKNR